MTAASLEHRGRYRHVYLLASLLAVIALPPFFAQRASGLGLVEVSLVIVLLAGVYATAQERRTFNLTLVLVLLAVIGRVGWQLSRESVALHLFFISSIAFFGVVSVTLTRGLFKSQEVSSDTISGALAVYLLLGFAWTFAYAMLEVHTPGSFMIAGEVEEALASASSAASSEGQDDQARFDRFVGFSFTTLTTLGYGNVSPANERADALAILEAIVGQGYLAIVIARLVALQIAQVKPAE